MEFKKNKTTTLTFRLEEGLSDKISEIAKLENVTKGEVVRVLVEKGVKEYKKSK